PASSICRMDTPGIGSLLFGLGLRVSLVATLDVRPNGQYLTSQAPSRQVCRYACGVALPKKAALYSMPVEYEQCLTRAQERSPIHFMHVTIKTPEEQEKMRVAGRLAAEVLDMIGEHVVPGVTTEELDRICHNYIVDVQGSIPANLNYRGF